MVTSSVFSFSVGIVTGIYLGQNYSLPNIHNWCMNTFKILESSNKVFIKLTTFWYISGYFSFNKYISKINNQ